MPNLLFLKLKDHIGHKIECVYYGPADSPCNIAIECVDCYMVLVDTDLEEIK
jgi:hypothetical protein